MSMLHKHAADIQLAASNLREIAAAWDSVIFCADVLANPRPDHTVDHEQKLAQLLEAIQHMRRVATR